MQTSHRTAPRPATYDRNLLFVGGRWVEPALAERLEVISPATEEVIARVPKPGIDDADRAVAAARSALTDGEWPQLSPAERADVMDRVVAEIGARAGAFNEAFTLETGGPISASAALTNVAVIVWRDYAEMCRTFPFEEERTALSGPVRVDRVPVGVAVGISPWNAPLAGVAFMIAPALAAGCTIVLKPAHEAPLAMYLLADAIEAAGVPEGVVSILPADRDIGEHLVRHPDVDKVALTGSTAAGKRVMALAAETMTRVTLELGGKSPAIVADDADLDSVIPTLIAGGMGLSGQVCCALTRILVSDARHDELVERLEQAIGTLTVGDPMDPATDIGPLALQRQLERVNRYIAVGREEGARLVAGGGWPAGLERGWFVEPTLFANVDNSMRIAREEIFGPVLSVIPYRDLDDAIAIANDSDYGLLASVFTRDPEVADRVARGLRSGQVHVNGYGTCAGQPFGGFKRSGVGRKGGPEGLSAYLETRLVQVHGGV